VCVCVSIDFKIPVKATNTKNKRSTKEEESCPQYLDQIGHQYIL